MLRLTPSPSSEVLIFLVKMFLTKKIGVSNSGDTSPLFMKFVHKKSFFPKEAPPKKKTKKNKKTTNLLKGRLQARRMRVRIFATASSNQCRWEPWILGAWITWIWFGGQKHEISHSSVVADKKFKLYCCHKVEQASWKGHVKRREEQTQVHSIRKSHQSWSRSFMIINAHVWRIKLFLSSSSALIIDHCSTSLPIINILSIILVKITTISMIIYITRCTAFKCGLLFHCTKAVQVHFEKQHIKGRLVEVWDDLWYLNQTWPLRFYS